MQIGSNDSDVEIMNKLVSLFFAHQIRMKMYHFQTNTYGGHKTSDSYLDGFSDKFDKFMEIAQGRFGKLSVNRVEFKVDMLNDVTVISEMDDLIQTLKLVSTKYKDFTELTNLIDEIVGDATQFKYLIQFK